MQETSVLSTKLFRPRLVRSLVERPRLLDRLNWRLHRRRLTIVSAPAGYGKTTLVAHWLATLDGPTAWVTLDKLNNDLDSFARYLAAAIVAAYPDSCRLSIALLDSPQPILPAVMADALIEDLANLPGTLAVALDDFYTVDAPPVHECVERVVQYLPTNCHLTIASRETPPWSLGRLRLSGELVEIGVEELRFTTAEAQLLFDRLLSRSLSDTEIESLERFTEGWAAGLQMAALGLGGDLQPDDLAILASEDQAIAGYLLDEVLDKQTEAVRDFLLRTAILDRVCDPLARAVVGSPPPGAPDADEAFPTMGRLMRANLFLTPLDNQHTWYRYHHLLQEFLQRRLAESVAKEEVRAMHRRAAAWLVAHGFVDEAIYHALAGGDEAAAVRIVADNMHSILNTQRWRLVGHWLELLPESARNHPAMLVAQGWVLNYQIRVARLALVVEKAEKRLAAEPLSAGERDLLQSQVDIFKAVVSYWLGNAESALRRSQSAQLGLGPGMTYARSIGLFYHSISLAEVADPAEGLAHAQQALETQIEPSDVFSANAISTQAFIHLAQGNLVSLQRAGEHLGKLGEKAGLPISVGFGHVYQGIAAYEGNNLPLAEDHLQRITQAPHEMNGRVAREAFVVLMMTQEALGRPRAADDILEHLRDFLIETDNTELLVLVEAAHVWLAAARGEAPALPRLVSPLSLQAAKIDMRSSYFISPLLARARYLIQTKGDEQLREARTILDLSREAAEALRETRRLVQILALQASLDAACGNEPAALDALRRSLQLAERGRMMRTYADCGPQLIPLLERLREGPPAFHYAERVLGAYASSAAAGAQPGVAAASVEPYLQLRASLTYREMEVLRLLADRLSNKEIASQMVVAPETIKRYNLRIFQKLGVNNRRAAVGLARHLGLIPA